MKILANGKSYETEEGRLLEDFLKEIGIDPSQVVVEINEEALTPGECKKRFLSPGDRLEVVQIVAGG